MKTELKKLVELSRAENGCCTYDLHQDNQNPEHFLMYEIWDSRAAWQAHVASVHLLEHLRVTKDAFEEAYVTEMSQIS